VTIHDTHVSEWLSPTQILAKSSNIGTLKIALNLGEPGLYSAFRSFGFGEPTGLPLPGEASGVLRPKGRPWFEVETANASFGQGVSVTTMQLAVAMSAIANGGKLMEPILVRRITTPAATWCASGLRTCVARPCRRTSPRPWARCSRRSSKRAAPASRRP
jgi:cell division protein FtsI (penicillin-binding protein 3)